MIRETRVEPAGEKEATKPLIQAGDLYAQGNSIFMPGPDKPSPISSDGKDLVFSNLWAGLQSSQPPFETLRTTAQLWQASAGRTAEGKASALFSNNSTDEQKLAAVRDMVKEGT